MAKIKTLTSERARELLNYDPETGWLTWRIMQCKRITAGSRAGFEHINKQGTYRCRIIQIDKKRYRESHVIWLVVTGCFPIHEIDHEDHDATNNRWRNLRDVTHIDNSKNRSFSRANKTGVTGVFIVRGKFRAYIVLSGKTRSLGLFDTIDQAAAARKEAEALHGFHPNHGK